MTRAWLPIVSLAGLAALPMCGKGIEKPSDCTPDAAGAHVDRALKYALLTLPAGCALTTPETICHPARGDCTTNISLYRSEQDLRTIVHCDSPDTALGVDFMKSTVIAAAPDGEITWVGTEGQSLTVGVFTYQCWGNPPGMLSEPTVLLVVDLPSADANSSGFAQCRATCASNPV